MPIEMKKEIRLHQRLFDSFYAGSTWKNSLWQLREALDIGDWTRFVNLFRSTVSYLNANHLSILRARKELFEEDDLSLDSVGCNIDPELSRQGEEINRSFNEPDFDVPEGNYNNSDLSNGSSDGNQEIERSDNWDGSEGENEGIEAEPAEQEDVNEGVERSSQDGLDDEDGLDSEDVLDNAQDLEQFRGISDMRLVRMLLPLPL